MADPSYYMRYPGFRNKAVTLSYDDGVAADAHLVEILDRYGLKCTFNINAGFFGEPMSNNRGRRMLREEMEGLLLGSAHEIAAHGYKHKHLTALPSPQLFYEILRDKRELEEIAKRPILGMAYAMGDFDDRVIALLKKAGIGYARTVKSTRAFRTPIDFLSWHPTCHHNDPKLMELADAFVKNTSDNDRPLLFYLWGHSYEFNVDGNWDVIERFAAFMGGREDLWYVTNGELFTYVQAYRALQLDAEGKTVYNPSAIDVYFSKDFKDICAPAGKTTKL